MKNKFKKLILKMLCGVLVMSQCFLASSNVLATEKKDNIPIESNCSCVVGKLGTPITLDDIDSTWKQSEINRIAGNSVSNLDADTATIPLLVIVAGFKNMPYDENIDYAAKIFTNEESVTNYYLEQSEKQFTFISAAERSGFGIDDNTNVYDKTNDGIIHVNIDDDHTVYDIKNRSLSNQKISEMAGKIIKEASEYVDFAAYDINKDGMIQRKELAVELVYAGYNAAYVDFCEGTDYRVPMEKAIWPVSMDNINSDGTYNLEGAIFLSEYLVFDNKKSNSIIDTSIATTCHELGHFLGLDDYYDIEYYENESWGAYEVLEYSLMAQNSVSPQNEGLQFVEYTVGLDAFSKTILKWAKPELVTVSGNYLLCSNYSDYAYNVIKIPTERPNEYYLLENRSFLGRDKYLGLLERHKNSQGGIIAWHVDENMYNLYHDSNSGNVSSHHQGVMPVYGEQDDKDNWVTIGTKVTKDPFLAAFWEDEDLKEWPVYLTLYPSAFKYDMPKLSNYLKKNDIPANRKMSKSEFAVISEPADVMEVYVAPCEVAELEAPTYESEPVNVSGNLVKVSKHTALVGDTVVLNIDGIKNYSDLIVTGKAGYINGKNIFLTRKGSMNVFAYVDGKKKKVLTIKAELPKAKAAIRLKSGKTCRFKLSGTKKSVDKYFSGHPSILTIDSDGNMTAVSSGIAHVYAWINGHRYDSVVFVDVKTRKIIDYTQGKNKF